MNNFKKSPVQFCAGDFMLILTYFCSCLLLICGIYLTFKSKFFQFVKLREIFKITILNTIKSRDTQGFKAMSLALGSTIGIGNIVGVTAAILIGGPGAVFWMLLTGFIGMIIKYAEVKLCVEETLFSKRKCGGPMYLLSNKLKDNLFNYGKLFSLVCILASLFAGNMIQSKSIYNFAQIGFNIDFLSISLIIIPLLAFILFGKDTLYQNISAVLVPLMALFYIASVIIITLFNANNVPIAFKMIFLNAFGMKEFGGGICGSVISIALRTGVMKGLFTHEAGMGSSPIAHCSAENPEAHKQGCWGIIEVFIDTVIVCMLTAICIITSPVYLSFSYSDPFQLICAIFQSVFGVYGIKLLGFSAICFAFASIIGWSFYGLKSLEFFTNNNNVKRLYIVLFLTCIPLSYFLTDSVVWILTDVFNSFMLIPNSTFLLIYGSEAFKTSKHLR